MKIVFATFNQGKVREARALLSGLDMEVLSPPEVGIHELPEETGETFLDNAVLKAAHVFAASGMASFSDDSGLEVPALGGAPGVRSARYGGVEHDDEANIRKLLHEIRGVADRRARFVCTVACILPDGDWADRMCVNAPEGITVLDEHHWLPPGTRAVVTTGDAWGRIIDTPAGSNGFGYDPVFFRDDLGRTFAQISRDEKNALSHRGQAIRGLVTALGRITGPRRGSDTQGEDRFDLVDEDGNVVGSALRRECHGNPDLLHQVVHVLIVNSRGELLLQKRSPLKDIQPGRWDTSVGGHLDPGESVAEAALREIEEEVGVQVREPDLRFRHRYIMRNEIESELVTTFTLVHEGPFTAQPEEVDALRYWSPEEIRANLGTGLFTPNFEDEFSRFTEFGGQSR